MAKILLVEDNEMNRDMLGRRLLRRGYQVLIAVDGAEGVAKVQTEVSDLILMDMSLPVIDGWDATGRLKEAPEMQQREFPVLRHQIKPALPRRVLLLWHFCQLRC